jgi:L-iditol 2-dehydrogenase
MKVAMYYNNKDVRIEEMPKPQISPDELLFKVKASGICGSDVLEWYRLKKAPLVLGHEAVGEIIEVGKNVSQYKKGQRIFVSHHVPCNTCRYCQSGNHTVCETLHTTNYYPGGFSEYVRVPKINLERGVFLLPREISDEAGTFIEPLACCLRGQRLANFSAGQSVLILGAGVSGLLHLLLARTANAGRIIVTDINNTRLDLAKKLGADGTINAKEDVAEKFRLINEDHLADLVIVCTSALSAFLQTMQSVERAGTILCFAATEPGVNVPVPVSDFWRKSIKIIHSYGAGPDDIKQAIKLLQKHEIPVKDLITHRLSLKEAGLGFKLVAEAKECLKVILFPE